MGEGTTTGTATALKPAVPLSIVIKKQSMATVSDSIVELPHVSPIPSPRSVTASPDPAPASPSSIHDDAASTKSGTAPSTSDVFHSIPSSPLPLAT
jgi:hypothetical protein